MATTQRQLVRNHLPANSKVFRSSAKLGTLGKVFCPQSNEHKSSGLEIKRAALADSGLGINSLWTLGELLPLSRPSFTGKLRRLDTIIASVSCILWAGIKWLSSSCIHIKVRARTRPWVSWPIDPVFFPHCWVTQADVKRQQLTFTEGYCTPVCLYCI